MTTDPFETLTAPAGPLTPRAEFALGLRRRIETELFPTIDTPERAPVMSTTESSAAESAVSTQRIIPYLCCRGAAEALDFYARALGAVEQSRMVGDDGRVGHAEITIQGARIMLADEHPEIDVFSPAHYGGSAVGLSLDVDDCDALYERAVAAGAIGLRPPADEFYGSRSATIADPFGHRWFLNTAIEQVSPAEMARRAADEGYSYEEHGTVTAPVASSSNPPVEVGYLTMATTDTARATRFFGSLFGWEFEAGHSGEGYAHIANTKLPMGFTPDGAGQPPTLYFRVESIDRYAARVRELGGTIVSTDTYDSGGSATCQDDQGATFLLWEPAPGY
ncbi:MAG: VOC family protein [Acidimicrobiia bacterium]